MATERKPERSAAPAAKVDADDDKARATDDPQAEQEQAEQERPQTADEQAEEAGMVPAAQDQDLPFLLPEQQEELDRRNEENESGGSGRKRGTDDDKS